MNYPEDFIDKIICGDCLEVMKDIPDGCIDLIVTDPPYSLNYEFENDDLSPREQYEFMKKYTKEFYRILRSGGTVCIFMEQRLSHYLYFALKKAKLTWKNEIIWNRDGGQMPTKSLGICHENINIWTKGIEHRVFNLDEIRVRSKYADTDKRLNPLGKNPGDVWYVAAMFGKKLERIVDSQGKAIHPTQKPIHIELPLLLAYSKEMDIVFDPFIGSGTTAEACLNTNRHFIGIDTSEKYCRVARDRIASVDISHNLL